MTGIEPEQTSFEGLKQDQNQYQYLTFTLGAEEYGIEILRVQEIKGYTAVSEVIAPGDGHKTGGGGGVSWGFVQLNVGF